VLAELEAMSLGVN